MKLHYELTGPESAPVIVLSNSLGTDLRMWDAQVPVLEKHFRVLRYDQRGHGSSPSAQGPYALRQLGSDVLELLDRAGLERVNFAGVSLGGMTGMWLAAHAADRIDRLALLCTSAQLGPAANWHERAATARRDGTGSLAHASVGRWFTPPFAARTDIRDKFGGMVTACDDEGYASCCEAIAGMDLLPDLDRIVAPSLVIAGEDDPATPPPHAERIADAVADARLEVLSQASHLANVEQAEAVNRLLLDHCTRSA